MASRDIRLDVDPQASLKPQSIGGAVNGSGIDLQGAEAALIVLSAGAATSAATVKVQESDDNTTFTDVADADLIGVTGNPAGFAATANTVQKISYVGAKRFVRVITTAGTAALLGVEVVRAHLRHAGGQPV